MAKQPQKQISNSLTPFGHLFTFAFILISTASFLAVLFFAPTQAATTSTLNFQGRLLQSNGAIVPDGYYNIQFKLYDGGTDGGPGGTGEANAGTNLWTESYYDSNGVTAGNDNRLRVVNGYFSANLGSQTAFGSIDWDQELWLTMNVGGTTQTATPTYDGEMLAPGNKRTKLTGVPYAFKAGTAFNVASNNTNQASTNSSNVLITTGNAAGATSNSGNITLDVGTATQATGAISIGTTNASAITIGSGTNTFSLQTSNIDISTAGAITGATGISMASGNFVQTGSGTFATGTGTVSLNGATTVNADFTANGQSLFQNSSNSTTAFRIQSSSATDTLFTVNTTNNRVVIGNATASAGTDTTLLVVDSATSANAPTGVNGGIFYDSTTNKFRCYQNSAFIDCISNGPTTVTVAASNSQNKQRANYIAAGTESDEDAINAAIASLPATGGTVSLLEGEFVVDGSILIPDNVSIVGQGSSTYIRIKDSNVTSFDVFENDDQVGGNTNIGIYKLRVDGNESVAGGNNRAAHFVKVGSGSGPTAEKGFTISEVTFEALRNHTLQLSDSHYSAIENSFIRGTTSMVMYVDTSTNLRFSGNKVVHVDGGWDSIQFNTASDSIISNNTFEGVYSTGMNAIRLNGASDRNTITGNVFEDYDVAIYIRNTSSYNVFDSNIAENLSFYPVYFNGGSNNVASNNTISNPQYDAILVVSSPRSIVSGNTINNVTFGMGIGLYGSSGSTVTGNSITNTAGYGIDNNENNNTIISNNVIDTVTGDGIRVNISSGVNVTGNRINDSGGSIGNSSILISGNSDNNSVTSNNITDTAGTGYAINISGATADNNYLADNRYSGTGATSINDSGTGTIFGGQLNGNDYLVQNAGNINLQAGGTSTTAVIQIGAGGAGSTTPDFLALDVKSTTGDPAGGAEGYMYYNTFDNKFRCYQNAAWTDCIGAGGAGTLQGAYDGGNTITTTDARDISFTLANTATDSNFLINIAASSASQLIVQNNGTDVLQIGSAGQLQLDVQGSAGGLLLGTDVQLFRGAADRLDLASGDSLNLVSGALQIAGTEVISSGRAISNVTGYSQSSGNFSISGAGTFATGTGTVSLNGATTAGSTLAITTLGSADTATLLCRNGSNQVATCNTTGTGAPFVQGGNSFGAQAVLGTNDNNSLAFETNGTTKWLIDTSGNLLPNADDTYNIGSDTARVQDIFVGPSTVHIGTSTSDEGTISYNTTTNNLRLGATNGILVQNNANSTTAFQVQNAAGTSLLTVNTSNSLINVGGNIIPGVIASTQSTSDVVTSVSAGGDVLTLESSMAIGVDGLPIMTYANQTDTDLMITKCNNADCTSTTTTQVTDTNLTGSYSSIAIGSDGLPIVAHYEDTGIDDLMITKCNNIDCTSNYTVTISDVDDIGAYPSVAIAPDGFPIISYTHVTDGNLAILDCGNLDCSSGNTITEIADADNTGYHTWVEIGTDGLPIIAYRNVTDTDLVIMHCGNASCSSGNTTTQSATANNQGFFISMKIGADGLPVMAHRDQTIAPFGVVITKCLEITCQTSTSHTITDGSDNIGSQIGLEIGADGLPIISYVNNTDADLVITKCGNLDCSSGNTTTQKTDANSAGWFTSIAILPGSNLPVVASIDLTSAELDILRCGNASCSGSGTTKVGGITIGSDAIGFETAYINNIQSAGISPFKLSTNGVERLSIAANGDVTFQNTDSASAFQIQNAAGTSLLTVNTSNSLINVGGNVLASSSSSSISTSRTFNSVETTNDVGEYVSTKIGNDGLPLISHHDQTNDDLMFTKCNDKACASRTTTIVWSTGSVGLFTSLAIGADNLPIISHYDDTNDDLLVTKCNNLQCTSSITTSLDTTGNVGQNTSITIGTDGMPVISYTDITNTALKVYKCSNINCTAGSSTTPDNTASVGGGTSIAISTDGNPIISYTDDTAISMKTVKCGNSSCTSGNTITTLATNTDTAGQTSIAIGRDGTPIIAWYSSSMGADSLRAIKCGNISCTGGVMDTIIGTTNYGAYPSITIGTDGLPVISSWSTSSGVRINKCSNMTCSSNTSTLIGSFASTWTSIAIGTEGYPIVAVHDNTDGDLEFLRCVDHACASSTASIISGGISIGSGSVGFETAYINNIQSAGMNPLNFSTNGVTRVSLDATGLTTFSGNILVGAQTNESGSNLRSDCGCIVNTSSTAGNIGGDTGRDAVFSSAIYNGSLYIATAETNAAAIYRYDGNNTWTQVSNATDGRIIAGDATDIDAIVLAVYNDKLYAGTQTGANTGAIYSYDGTTWTLAQTTRGTFGAQTLVDGVTSLAVHNGRIYAFTQEANLASVYRFDGNNATWTLIGAASGTVVSGDAVDADGGVLTSYGGHLWAGVITGASTGRVAKYDGNSWTLMNTTRGTFATGTTGVDDVTSLAVYNNQLFVGTAEANLANIYVFNGGYDGGAGANVFYKTTSTSGRIDATNDATDVDAVRTMTVYNGRLYAGSDTGTTTGAIYEYTGISTTSANGWTIVNGTRGTFGAQSTVSRINTMIAYNGSLYVGTNTSNIGSMYVWSKTSANSYSLNFGSTSTNIGGISFVGGQQTTSNTSNTGSFLFTHGISSAAGAYDIAEDYPTRDEDLQPGSLVSIDKEEVGFVTRTKEKQDSTILGVFSEKPGLRLSQKEEHINGARAVPIALAGRVPVNVTNENGPIAPGDYLTSSSTPGYAMKAVIGGPTVGKALEAASFTDGNTAKVITFINVSYYLPPANGVLQAPAADFGTLNILGNATVNGSLNVSGDTSLVNLNVTGTATVAQLTVTGNATFEGQILVNGKAIFNKDIALGGKVNVDRNAITQLYKAGEDLMAGQVVVIDDNATDGSIKKATSFQDPKVIGVVITDASSGQDAEVAVAGRVQVRTKVDVIYIPGDLLVSEAEGVAGKSLTPTTGTVLGKATSIKDSEELVWVQLTLQ